MKLIDKDALVAEIEKKINEINLDSIEDWRYRLQREHDIEVMKNVLSIINTLEVKEVDLEKECFKYFEDNDLCVHDDYIKFARYFFELGLKAQITQEEK